MKSIISWVVSIAIFVQWMGLVGNPSTTETIIGLVLSGGVGLWICDLIKC